jgi:TatD DNase family protein
MRYYNIHTHQASGEPGVVEIVNVIIKDQADEMEKCSALYRSYGIHPWYIYNVGEQMEKLKTFVSLKETVAIGEAGLDKMTETNFEIQEKIFRAQALLAESIKKPLVIHCVKAWRELLAVKREMKPSMPWIIHGFRGKPELAEQLAEQGFYLSFGSQFNPAALLKAWPDCFLAETDDAGVKIQAIYRQIAERLDLPVEIAASKLAENTTAAFLFH